MAQRSMASSFLMLDLPDPPLALPLLDERGRPSGAVAIGSVIGTALNHREEYDALKACFADAPYRQPPLRPVLYLKPRNTHVVSGSTVTLPFDVPEVAIAGCVGALVGSPITRATPEAALAAISGYTVAADISVPHKSFYRPAIRQKCRDGFCPLGPHVVSANSVSDPSAIQVAISINGELVDQSGTAELVRTIPQLFADISAFMTLYPGDVVLAGRSHGVVRGRRGDHVEVHVKEIGVLAFTIGDDE